MHRAGLQLLRGLRVHRGPAGGGRGLQGISDGHVQAQAQAHAMDPSHPDPGNVKGGEYIGCKRTGGESMSIIIKGMEMPYGCANCSFCSSPIYDAKGFATYSCNVDVEYLRGKNITSEVLAMYDGARESFPDFCPLEEAPEQKHGKWICDGFTLHKCSICGFEDAFCKPNNFCANCGAKMN